VDLNETLMKKTDACVNSRKLKEKVENERRKKKV
jgi:hypothetical protein